MKLIQSATPAPRITTQSVMYADADVGYWHKTDIDADDERVRS